MTNIYRPCAKCGAQFWLTLRQRRTARHRPDVPLYCSGRCAASARTNQRRRARARRKADLERWERIYREKFQDPTYYGRSYRPFRVSPLHVSN